MAETGSARLQRPGRRPSTQKPCAPPGRLLLAPGSGGPSGCGRLPFWTAGSTRPRPGPCHSARGTEPWGNSPSRTRHRSAQSSSTGPEAAGVGQPRGRVGHGTRPAMPHRTASRKPVPGVSPEHRGATEWSEITDTPTDIVEEAPAQAGCHCSGSRGASGTLRGPGLYSMFF